MVSCCQIVEEDTSVNFEEINPCWLERASEESSDAGMGGMPGGGMGGGMGGMPGMMGGMPGGMGGMSGMSRGPRKDPPIEYPLNCTLEELYKGTSKKMKISRNVIDGSGSARRVDETLQVDVKPGWKNRTKVTFGEKGMPYVPRPNSLK